MTSAELTAQGYYYPSDCYEKGRQDGIDELYDALTGKRCECCASFRKKLCKGNTCFIDRIAEDLKEQNK